MLPRVYPRITVLVLLALGGWIPALLAEEREPPPEGRIFYVRQTVGDDTNDGLSPETAWESVSKLGPALSAGDSAYVGPGLYRDQIVLTNSGSEGKWIRFIADVDGQHTGDPPGIVMIVGSDPIWEGIFEPTEHEGVYRVESLDHPVAGVVEMDGLQYRYLKARDAREHLRENVSETDVVIRRPSSFYHDHETGVLLIHTSDGKPPTEHEIELIRRGGGISMSDKHYVSVEGFTFRHSGDAGVKFYTGSSNVVAINNTSYGSRQGIRVYAAPEALIYGNTLFRNDNCGVYFAKESTNGHAINNVLYDNIKGVRWSSDSSGALVTGNVIFDNHERGISLENVSGVRMTDNTVINNTVSQLLDIKSNYFSEGNCWQSGKPDQLIAELSFFQKYSTLADYRQAEQLDISSREGNCDPLPAKVDVERLHAESMAYTERARELLKSTD